MIYFETDITGHHEFYILINHDPIEGYPLAANGTIIKERLTIEEFANRLINYSDRYRGTNIYNVLSDLRHLFHSKNYERISNLNKEYMRMMCTNVKLPEHYVSYCSSQPFHLSAEYPGDEIKIDDDIYYLLA